MMDLNNLWSDIKLAEPKQNTRCLAVNTILAGKYLVGPVLGQGGFGITYVGYDLNMETRIAIKEYFPVELASRDTTTMYGDRVLSISGEKTVTYQQGLKKYVTEARNVSQFAEIPGIVSVKDFFYENETAYIIMEYIDGISLKEYLKEKDGILSEEDALHIMRPVLEALEKVHSAGIIHRDISPDNIMLTFEEDDTPAGTGSSGANGAQVNGSGTGAGSSHVGRAIKSVKLIDFGAARMTSKNDQKSLTIILKHGYAPEEQYRTHGEQGPWTDVYAVCAVLYRMLTGQTPAPAMDRLFKDELKNFEELGFLIGNDKNAGQITANTSAAILKGLAVKKDDRIQSMEDLIAALYAGKKVKAAAAEQKKFRMLLGVGAAAVLVCALILTGSFLIYRKQVAGNLNSGNLNTGNLSADNAGAGNAVTGEAVTGNVAGDEDGDSIQAGNGNADNAQTGSEQAGSTGGKNTGSETSGETMLSFGDAEEIGEQIVYYHPQNAINCEAGILFCKPDGTVSAKGENSHGQCDVQDWDHIVSVCCGGTSSLGLRQDGRVVAVGNNNYGQCDVEHWTDIVDIACNEWMSFGVTADGRVLTAGAYYEEHGDDILNRVSNWTDIKAVDAWYTGTIVGLKYDGTVVIEGEENPNTITGWDKVEDICMVTKHILAGIEADGTVLMEYLDDRDGEKPDTSNIPALKQINERYLGVTTEGKVWVKSGYMEENVQKELESWSDLVAVYNVTDTVYYGLQEDGTILETFAAEGSDSLEEFKNLEWAQISITDSTGRYCVGIIARTKSGKTLCYSGSDFHREACSLTVNGKQIRELDYPVVLYEDGTIYYSNSDLASAPQKNVKQIVPHSEGCYFLLNDGTVQNIPLYGTEEYWEDSELHECLAGWTDIVQICGDTGFVCGLKKDGTLVFTLERLNESTKDIRDITQLCYGGVTDTKILGLKEDGTVEVIYDSGSRKGETQVDSWTDITQLAMGEAHTVGLKSDGTVVATGSNHCGQCDVEEWKDVVYIDACNRLTIGITRDGQLLMAGSVY